MGNQFSWYSNAEDSKEAELPIENIIEILRLLPVKSVSRFRCVSKTWNEIIEDRYLVQKSLERAIPNLFLSEGEEDDQRPFAIKNNVFECITCRDGLILERGIASKKYRIRNPATHRELNLPDPHESIIFLCLVVSREGMYKLVSLYKAKRSMFGCEVLALERKELEWRPLQIPEICDLPKGFRMVEILEAAGVIFLVRVSKGEFKTYEVLALDTDSESIIISIVLPPGRFAKTDKLHAIDWNNRFAFASIVEKELHVLVLKDYNKKIWSEKIVIPLRFMKRKKYTHMILIPLTFSSGVFCFSADTNEILLYDTRDQKLYRQSAPEEDLDLYQESLVSLKGMKPETIRKETS